MRVLFTTSPGSGHVHPMVPLARALLERGCDVCWAAAPEVCDRLEREGFEARRAGLGDSEGLGQFFERFPEVQSLAPRDRPVFMFPRVFGAVRAPRMLADLLPIVDEWRPSVVVHDAAELAGPIAAAVAGVPSVTHSFGGLLPTEKLAAADAQMAGLWEAQGLEPRPYGGNYDHLYLDIYPSSLHPSDVELPTPAERLRPVAFAMTGAESAPDSLGTSTDRPLVYVTFGTTFNKDVPLIRRVVDALVDLSLRVLVTVGPTGDPSALGPTRDGVHVARYIPQTQVLPACAAVASHAGSGTFLASFAHGLPQLCLPQAADQFDNAAACVRAGAGVELDTDDSSPEAIRHAAERVVFDTGIRAAARRLGDEIASMPEPAAVAAILQQRFER